MSIAHIKKEKEHKLHVFSPFWFVFR